jgi:hypothetical protein
MTMLEIQPDATLETPFDCVHWRCKLIFRCCLSRQAEVRRKGPRAKDSTPVPIHPFCAQECDDGRIVAARFGALRARTLVRTAFGALQEERPCEEGAG